MTFSDCSAFFMQRSLDAIHSTYVLCTKKEQYEQRRNTENKGREFMKRNRKADI